MNELNKELGKLCIGYESPSVVRSRDGTDALYPVMAYQSLQGWLNPSELQSSNGRKPDGIPSQHGTCSVSHRSVQIRCDTAHFLSGLDCRLIQVLTCLPSVRPKVGAHPCRLIGFVRALGVKRSIGVEPSAIEASICYSPNFFRSVSVSVVSSSFSHSASCCSVYDFNWR